MSTGPVNATTPSSGNVSPSTINCLLIAVLNAGGVPLTITEEAGWLVAEEYEGGGNQVPLSMIYKLDDCLSRERRLDGKQHTELSGARRRVQATAGGLYRGAAQ